MCPRVGFSTPSNNLTVVDLPEPFGPSKPKTSPRRTSKSTLSTARAFGRPQKSLKTLVKPLTETIGCPNTGLFPVDGADGAISAAALMRLQGLASAEQPPLAWRDRAVRLREPDEAPIP